MIINHEDKLLRYRDHLHSVSMTPTDNIRPTFVSKLARVRGLLKRDKTWFKDPMKLIHEIKVA